MVRREELQRAMGKETREEDGQIGVSSKEGGMQTTWHMDMGRCDATWQHMLREGEACCIYVLHVWWAQG